jgi:hypothetical protein
MAERAAGDMEADHDQLHRRVPVRHPTRRIGLVEGRDDRIDLDVILRVRDGARLDPAALALDRERFGIDDRMAVGGGEA